MTANELRIGNYILSLGYDEDSNGNIFHEEEGDEVTKVTAQTLFYWKSTILGYEPIPLTEEWLLKFGFEFYDYELDDEEDVEENETGIYKSYRLNKSKFLYYAVFINSDNTIDFCVKPRWCDYVALNFIQYVHQLQNLYFALTNTELELKLKQ